MPKYGIFIYKNAVEIRLHNRKMEIWRGYDKHGEHFIIRAYNCLSKETLEHTPDEEKSNFAKGKVRYTEIIFTAEAMDHIVKAYLSGIPCFNSPNSGVKIDY